MFKYIVFISRDAEDIIFISLESLSSSIDAYMCKKRLTRSMRKLGKHATCDSSRKSLSQNSIIVINDSDSEIADGDNGNETNKEEDTSLNVIDCIAKPSTSMQQRRKSRISSKQNRLSVIPLDDSSGFHSDTQESVLNEENIGESTLIVFMRKDFNRKIYLT